MAGHALVEGLLALRRVGFGEVEFDRLLGGRGAFAFLLNAGDRVAHLLRPLGMEQLARNDRRAERNDPCEQHPAGDGVETVVHEASLLIPEPGIGTAPPLKWDFSVHQAASQRSSKVRPMAALGGGRKAASGAPSSAAATSSRVNQRASSSSAVSMVSASPIASVWQPIISDDGKGQG